MIGKCPVCIKERINYREPMIESPLPCGPCEEIAADICFVKGSNYLVVTDYYSLFIEVTRVENLSSGVVCRAFKAIKARYGIPKILPCDNGTHFCNWEF